MLAAVNTPGSVHPIYSPSCRLYRFCTGIRYQWSHYKTQTKPWSIQRNWDTQTHKNKAHLCPHCPKPKIPHKSDSLLQTHTHITFSLRPPAIDFQALLISDDQTIDELRSISQPTAPGISAAPCVYVCVLVQLCLWVERWRGVCVSLPMWYLIGALRAELHFYIWFWLQLIEWPHTHTYKSNRYDAFEGQFTTKGNDKFCLFIFIYSFIV